MNGMISVLENKFKQDSYAQQQLETLSLSEKDHEAINLFEKAIEKESHGLMSDAVGYYRKAFKINEQVDILYRTQKLPHTVHRLKQEGGKNIAKKVDEEMVRAINVDELLESYVHSEAHAPGPYNPDLNPEDSLTIRFANVGLDNHEEIANDKPISPLIKLPHDIWLMILEMLLVTHPESWFNFSITCQKNAYLGFGYKNIWRKLSHLIYPNQVYYENKLYLQSQQSLSGEIDWKSLPVPKDQLLIIPQFNNSWKYMLHNRPFIKFFGCYISVVNYYSEGGKAEFSSSWSNPVRTITYYRYLRFYPDGTCIKVLSTLEPNNVIPFLSKFNQSKSISGYAPEMVKMGSPQVNEHYKIYHGDWTISTTGEVHIEIKDGSVPYYNFHYHFQIKSLGDIFKHSKLNWLKYYAIRKKMSENDDREGEEALFSLKNEKPFKFSRVRSYTIDN